MPRADGPSGSDSEEHVVKRRCEKASIAADGSSSDSDEGQGESSAAGSCCGIICLNDGDGIVFTDDTFES
jgi:hypothetical protein